MDIRFTYAQSLFGVFGGIVLAHYLAAPWWGYVIAAPAMGALSYAMSLWRLRSLDMKADIMWVDYIEERRRRWRG